MGSPIDGGLGCFEDLTIANCAATKVCVGLWPDAFNSPEKIPQGKQLAQVEPLALGSAESHIDFHIRCINLQSCKH